MSEVVYRQYLSWSLDLDYGYNTNETHRAVRPTTHLGGLGTAVVARVPLAYGFDTRSLRGPDLCSARNAIEYQIIVDWDFEGRGNEYSLPVISRE